MIYMSELTGKKYNTAEECEAADKKYEEQAALEKKRKDELAAERKAAAHDVEEKLKAASEANKAYKEALTNFCKKYGTYHTSISNVDDINSIFDWYDLFWKL